MSHNDKGPIPLIAIVVSVLMIVIGLRFAYGFYVDPAALAPGLDLAAPPAQRLMQSLGARSLSMALALLLALLLRSRSALIVVLAMRLLTEAQDVWIAVRTTGAEPGLVVTVSVLMVLELAAIVVLWRRLRADR